MASYQTSFRDALLDPGLNTPAGLQDYVGNPTAKRFNVYRNNVVVSLVEALCSGFPALVSLVGEEYFKAIAREFALQHPPSSPVMLFYGEAFPAFLETFEPTQSLNFLPDVARVEVAWRRAFHAADALPLSPETLSNISPEGLEAATIKFHPSSWFMASKVAAYDLWRVGRGFLSQDQMGDLAAQNVVVVRPHFDVMVQGMSSSQFAVLSALRAGETLGAALNTDLNTQDDFSVEHFFTWLLNLGLIHQITQQQ